MKKKKIYEQPETAVTRVELESPICSGSVDITNNHGTQGLAIENQDINTSFDYTPTGGSVNGWDEIANNTNN